jgi:iron complex outermembrane receptor protein
LQAYAQTSSGSLDEVLVTAERRDVSLQNVPISAIVISAEALDKRGIKTFDDLQYQVPSMTFTDNGNSKFVNIRGVGISESAPNQTVGVAVHLDGAYVAREFVFGDAFFDVASVEVLRGPQGTYSGQNASGGAIFINSRKPVIGRADGFANVDLGNYNLRRLGAGSSFTLTDTLALRFAGEWERRDSFYRNHGPDLSSDPARIEDQPGNLSRSLGRVQVLFQPSDALELRLIHEMSEVRSDGVPYKFFPVRGTNILPATGERELNYDLDGHRNVTYNRTTGQATWSATDAFDVRANLSYLESHQHYLQDQDRNSVATNPAAVQDGADYTINDHYWTAEVNLVSTSKGPLEWTLGASHLDYLQNNYLNFLRYNAPGANPPLPGTGLDVTRHTRQYFFLENVRKNSAVFGEIGYALTSQWTIKAGVRQNTDEVGFSPDSYISRGPFPAGRLSHYNSPTGTPTPARILKFNATTGRVLVNFKPTEDHLIYATVSRGYKPGGTTPLANEYKSETVTNYELGWKGDLFNRRLTTSISAFYMQYANFQRTYNPDPAAGNSALQITNNVDGSTIKGIEAQFAGDVANFSWDLSFAYSKGEYGNLSLTLPAGAINGVLPTTATVFNLDGLTIDYLPQLTWNAGLSYMGWVVGGGHIVPSVRVTHQDEYYTTFFHYDYNLTPAKTLVDVSLAYEADKNWRVDLYAKNIADKTYISRAQGGTDARGSYLLGNPRQVGIKFNYRF